MTKRILSLILALLMIFSCLALASCGEEKSEENKEQKKNEEQVEQGGEVDVSMKVELSDATLDIPEGTKYDCDFTVFAPTPYGIDFFVNDTPNGDPVRDALYNRNLQLQDTLGVTVKCIDYNTSTDKQAKKINELVLAGDQSFDAAAIHSTSACASLLITNSVLSFDNLEYCDLEKPWWIQNFSENCSMFDEDYFAVSSACYNYYQSAACILYNKTLAGEANLPDIYELVRKGNWTVDKLISLTKNYSQDLNSDGVYDEQDLIAIMCDDHAYMNYWYGAFRQSVVSKGEDDAPVYEVKSQRMEQIVTKLNNLFNSGRRGLIYSMNNRSPYTKAFAEGRCLFFVCSIGTAMSLRDYDINFGIIPLPKLNEEQEEYGSWVDPWHLTLCVPINCEDPEKTGIILEAMAYYSYQMIYPAVVEQKIFGAGTRDTESLEMLTKYVFPGVYFDFGYIYDGWGDGYSSLLRTLIPENSKNISSFIAERQNKAESHYEEVYDAARLNAKS